MLLSQSAYAKHRGCTRGAVQKAIKSGRIKTVDGKIDPEQADKDWRANTNQAFNPRENRPKRTIDPIVSALFSDPKPEREKEIARALAAQPYPPSNTAESFPYPASETGDADRDYWKNKANREYYAAQNERLKFERDRGSLIPRSEIVQGVGGLIAAAKTKLRAIGNKLGPLLAMETQAAVCEAMVDQAVDEALAEIAQWMPPPTQA